MADADDKNAMGGGALPHAGQIIERFGGIRFMARRLGLPVATIQGWKIQDRIPAERSADVLALARENNIDLSTLGAAETPAASAAHDDAGTGTRFDAAIAEAMANAPSDAPRAVFQMPNLKSEADRSAMIGQIKAAEVRAIQKGALVTVLLLTLTGLAAAFLLWPAKEQLAKNDRQLAELQQQTSDLQRAETQTKIAVPQQIQQSLNQFKSSLSGAASQVDQATGLGLEGRVARLEQQVAALASPAALESMLVHVVNFEQSAHGRATLAQTVHALNGAVRAPQGDDSDSSALSQAVQASGAAKQVLAGVSPSDLKAAALLLGMTEMRSALWRDDVPFDEDLALLQKTIGSNDPELNDAVARLAPVARLGVYTPDSLIKKFAMESAGEILNAPDQSSMEDKALNRLGSVVEVRKNGNLIGGSNVQGTVDQAKQAMAHGDLAGGVAGLQTLRGPAAAAAAPWLRQANATLLAQRVAGMIGARVSAKLGAGGLALTTLGAPMTSLPSAAMAVTPEPLVTEPAGSTLTVPTGAAPGPAAPADAGVPDKLAEPASP